jgi:hypothetical protein
VKAKYFFSFFLLITILALGQAKQDKYGSEAESNAVFRAYTPSEGSVTFDKMKYENPNTATQVLTLLKYDNKDLLMGNECVKEETVKMGFQYIVVCQPRVTFSNKVWLFFYNFGSNVELTFRNGFGWKKRLNEKIVECKRSSGDFVW